MKIEILKIKIDKINLPGVLEKISEYLKSPGQNYIVTINPEFVVAAQKNQDFKNVLNQADLATCDGIGLVFASKGKLKRVTGVDLTEKLLIADNIPDAKLYLIGGQPEVAKKIIEKYPQAKIVGAESGGKLCPKTFLLEKNEEVIQRIKKSQANILLASFSQVKQEMWIAKNLSKMPNIKVAIGVGGTFNYLSGKIKRAPKCVRKLGLEWFFRLICQPRRIKRIFNATIRFGYLFLKSKSKKRQKLETGN